MTFGNMIPILLIAAAYLLGAVPFGLILSRLKGVDIRAVGSGNIGATNVFRSVSKGLGIATFVCDFLKGFVPAYVFPILGKMLSGSFQGSEIGILCGVAAIVGHNWPVYLKFKGGKGIATSAGVLLGIAPAAVGIGLLQLACPFRHQPVCFRGLHRRGHRRAGGFVDDVLPQRASAPDRADDSGTARRVAAQVEYREVD